MLMKIEGEKKQISRLSKIVEVIVPINIVTSYRQEIEKEREKTNFDSNAMN